VPKIIFYHIRTLFWTYLVWAALNVLFALSCCNTFKYPLTEMPYYWAVLHIGPFWMLILALWHGATDMFIFFTVPAVVAGFAIVVGLLIKGRWARFLIIIGMSIWFILAFCTLAMGA